MLPSAPAQGTAQAVLLVHAGLAAALAAALAAQRPGWRDARAAAVRALGAALLSLRGRAGAAEHAAHAAHAATLGREFAAADGVAALARLLPRSPPAVKTAVVLANACPEALTLELLAGLLAAVGSRFSADAASADALRALRSLLAAHPAAVAPALALHCKRPLCGGALPLLLALATTLADGVGDPSAAQEGGAAAARAARRAEAVGALSDAAAAASGPFPAARALAHVPTFLAPTFMMDTLIHACHCEPDAARIAAYTPALCAALRARCALGPPPMVALRRLAVHVASADAAARCRAGGGGGRARLFRQHARAEALGRVATTLLRTAMTTRAERGSTCPEAATAAAMGIVLDHPRGLTLLDGVLDGDGPVQAAAERVSLQDAFDGMVAGAEAEQARAQADADAPDGGADGALGAALGALAAACDGAAFAASSRRGVRIATRRAMLALSALSVALRDPDGARAAAAGASAPTPGQLLLAAQQGFYDDSASMHHEEAAHAEQDTIRDGDDAPQAASFARTAGLNFTSDMPELFVLWDLSAHAGGESRMPSVPSARAGDAGAPKRTVDKLCVALLRAGAAHVLALADAALEAEEEAEEEAEDAEDSSTCTPDAPARGTAARLARAGFALRERDARVLPALWAQVAELRRGGAAPMPPPPPDATLDAITWRFVPARTAPHAPERGYGDFAGSWRDLSSAAGGAMTSGGVHALHVHVSAAWRQRARAPSHDAHAPALHALPQLECAAHEVLAAHPALADALVAMEAIVDAAGDADGCTYCAMCRLTRDVGAICALPGCGAVMRVDESEADGDGAAGRDPPPPGVAARALQRCAGCRRVAYCCDTHSRRDWARHRRDCRAAQAEAAPPS
jgi:hypothetical protein